MPVNRALKDRPEKYHSSLVHRKRDRLTEEVAPGILVEELEVLLGVTAKDLLEFAGMEGTGSQEDVEVRVLRFALYLTIVEANLHGQPWGTPLSIPKGEEVPIGARAHPGQQQEREG